MGSVFFILTWCVELLRGIEYGFYSKTLMIFLGLFGILIHKKPHEYGLVPKDLAFSLKWSFYTVILFIPASILAVSVSFITGSLKPFCPFVLVGLFIWFFIFTGLAEELFFRGYVQSRLNEVFSKKYESILGVEYEWSQGTLITRIVLFWVTASILRGQPPNRGDELQSIDCRYSLLCMLLRGNLRCLKREDWWHLIAYCTTWINRLHDIRCRQICWITTIHRRYGSFTIFILRASLRKNIERESLTDPTMAMLEINRLHRLYEILRD